MKETSHKQLHFSDDYDTEQLNQIKIMKQKAKLQNKENKEPSIYYCVRGTPSKNLRIVAFPKKAITKTSSTRTYPPNSALAQCTLTDPTYIKRLPTISLINSRSMVNKIDFINEYIDDNNIDILAITETWLKDDDIALIHQLQRNEFMKFLFNMGFLPKKTFWSWFAGAALKEPSIMKSRNEKVQPSEKVHVKSRFYKYI